LGSDPLQLPIALPLARALSGDRGGYGVGMGEGTDPSSPRSPRLQGAARERERVGRDPESVQRRKRLSMEGRRVVRCWVEPGKGDNNHATQTSQLQAQSQSQAHPYARSQSSSPELVSPPTGAGEAADAEGAAYRPTYEVDFLGSSSSRRSNVPEPATGGASVIGSVKAGGKGVGGGPGAASPPRQGFFFGTLEEET
jgi:hypothetical protein